MQRTAKLDKDLDSGEGLLPDVDANTLGRRELQFMFRAYFAVPSDHELQLPVFISPDEEVFADVEAMSRQELREYYEYAFDCQEKKQEPKKMFVPLETKAHNPVNGSAKPGEDGDKGAGKSDDGKKPDEAPTPQDFSPSWLPAPPPPSPAGEGEDDKEKEDAQKPKTAGKGSKRKKVSLSPIHIPSADDFDSGRLKEAEAEGQGGG